MIKKTVTYEDFDGNMQTDTFYFNLTKAEILEMEVRYEGGLHDLLVKIVKEKDNKKILSHFKEIILDAYGIRSDDGRGFKKSDELREAFADSAAFQELWLEIATSEESGAAFINGIVPKQLKEEATKSGSWPVKLETAETPGAVLSPAPLIEKPRTPDVPPVPKKGTFGEDAPDPFGV